MIFPLLRGRAQRSRAGLAFLVLLSLLLARPAWATHIRAGDIQAKSDTTAARNPLRVFFKMITYTDRTSPADAKNDEVIFFGDGTNATVFRQGNAGVNIGNNINRNVYYFEHTYNAPGQYFVSFIGENRATGIRNFPLSDQRNFYIHTRVTIDPLLGVNRSPVLNAPAVDRAARQQVFLHNPAASDADGDSLAFKLRVCQWEPRGVQGVIAGGNRPQPVNLPGYVYPQDQSVSPGGVQVPYTGPPVGVPGSAAILELNEITGQLVWNSPSTQGDYNVAFVIEEWRRDAFGSRRLIGEVVRDMQITVFATNNLRPTVFIPLDTCVVAGTTITRNIRATDPDNNNIRLTAYGGVLPPATFVQTVNQPGRAVGRFTWNTSCSDIATDPKIIVFKAEDVPAAGTPLIDERPWRVTVVGPPPTNLQATVTGVSAQLTWDRYLCQANGAATIRIFRKENPSNWTPSTCETGIPASAGYVQVGQVAANLQSFTDTNANKGLERGKTYCYRIFAEFPRPAGGASIASQEACVTLQGRAALFTNVTVDQTSTTTGQITVKWTKPVSTTGFNPPVGYRLYRAETQNPATGAYTLVRTISNLNDTTHVDTNLDTETKAYTYRLEFFSNLTAQPGSTAIVENAGPASSVRLSGVANALNNSIKLSWTYNVPWDNSRQRTRIFRRNPGSTTFTLVADTIATRNGGTFTDRSSTLRKNQTYCYYVETNGTYGAANLPSNLVNLSQVRCVNLASIPCPPVLTLRPTNCDSVAAALPRGQALLYSNYLRWTLGSTPADCGRNIAFYRVLYRPTEDGPLTEIGRTPVQSFVHRNLASAAGCYAVIAVDSLGNESAQSNVECQDNCQIFVLPNIFTPNGDQRNDVFRPIYASPVNRVKVQVFNRWGAKVYEGIASPDLTLWDGGGARSNEGGGRDTGAKATGGTYYYLLEVEFADLKRTVKTYKGWVEIMR
ncbi:gliding motility-associated C-terminal domain-containing protein [Hymenobacter gummosus]|uniref:Gliding motility-associated C-terminal domain-containing protein n=1 Tax=Hymenobacter gummosus TaxID=1776032 RepID=A0A3S0J5Y2_9BACT|nr:gliding motility-associated C-terminal domain-containing protein [Hymenobacter gummosus]RTQ45407.1 gliding motility-associated C-terminal domain-containing protein [Hymenobacter gummosus]